MSYIKSNLSKDEKVIKEISLHWWYWFGVVLNFLLVITAPLGLLYLIRGLTLDQAVTNKRVIIKSGWISRKVEEIRLFKIETVEYRQGIFGRILGFGTVKVTGAGLHNTVTTFLVNDPKKVKQFIDDQLD